MEGSMENDNPLLIKYKTVFNQNYIPCLLLKIVPNPC